MFLTLIAKEGMTSTVLPEKIAGQFWLGMPGAGGRKKTLSAEGAGEKWILKAGRGAQLLGADGKAVRETDLEPYALYPFRLKETKEQGIVFCEPVSADRSTFRRMVFGGRDTVIRIGRGANNQICYREPFVSTEHACLTYAGGTWTIEDKGSANGTFVNGKPVQKKVLSNGDMIYILGLKLLIGQDCLAFNDPGSRIAVSIPGAVEAEPMIYLPGAEREEDEPEETYYSRSPRFKREIEPPVIKIDTPPQNQIGQEMPWILTIGSSVTMGLMSGVMLISAVISQNTMSMISGGVMMIGTLLMPIITKNYERKRKREREALRQKKYTEYLGKIRQRIEEESRKQETILRENHVTIGECEQRIMQTDRRLWERDSSQNDFLLLRTGLGTGKLQADIQYGERRFTLDEDNLSEELLHLGEEDKILKDVPIPVSFRDNYVSGVIGRPEDTLEFVKGLIFQMAAFYSYDEVKMIFLYDPSQTDLDFVKWLPHVWNDDRSMRFLAAEEENARELSAYFEGLIEDRSALHDDELKEVQPYYVIFDFQQQLSAKMEMMKQLLGKKKNLGMSVVAVREDFAALPKECRAVIDLESRERARIFDRSNISGEIREMKPDIYLSTEASVLAKKLADTRLDLTGKRSNLPKMISFLEMYGVGRLEHLNPSVRWRENDPTKTLQVPVGVDTAGNLFYMDLHEKYHGPHGLIAGMTGSGKSEFIITYILSLAVNYRPEEVAFVLIDYKGGGLTGAFEDSSRGIRLPHLVGTITNLDGNMVKRSLISIQSELRRRQAVFNEARRVSNEGTMDIYKYQRLYREHVVTEPMPHLFIISDEFAELKMQQPEFMEQLVSAARIGRSLGVHLILATQKPSGVVDDQIWSNSRFRVCLKVQDKADSMDMIKRPEAASLVETGRFYLQVGFNEYFDMGQSAWCGAPYLPSDRPQKNVDNSIRVVDRMGRTVREIKPAIQTGQSGGSGTRKQIVSIVSYLSDLAAEEKITSRNLWLDPIPAKIYSDELKEKYNYRKEPFVLEPLVGEYDDPYHQKQHLMTVPLSEEGNLLVYGSTGSGKEQFLHSMIYALLTEHPAEELHLYLLDFGSETMFSYRKAPQVGDVLLSSDREKLENLFKMLQEEYLLRKGRFMAYGGNYRSFLEMSGETLPNIVVVVNNYAAFNEMFEDMDDALAFLAREGPKYGMYVVMTVASASGIRYRMQQSFKQMLVLQMNDPSDYTGIMGPTDGMVPSPIHGRGIVRYDMVYEFQTACSTRQENLIRFNEMLSEKLAEGAVSSARRIPVLPERVDAEFVAEEIRGLAQIPVGMDGENLRIQTVDLKRKAMLPVLAQEEEGCCLFAEGLAEVLAKAEGVQTVVLDPERTFTGSNAEGYRLIQDGIEAYIGELILEVAGRYNAYKEAGEEAVAECAETVVIMNGLKTIYEELSEDGQDKLRLILEKSAAVHRMHFVLCSSADGWSSVHLALYRKRNKISDGIWAGEGIADQYELTVNRRTSEEGQTPDIGYIVTKGRAVKVKLLEPAFDAGGGDDYE